MQTKPEQTHYMPGAYAVFVRMPGAPVAWGYAIKAADGLPVFFEKSSDAAAAMRALPDFEVNRHHVAHTYNGAIGYDVRGMRTIARVYDSSARADYISEDTRELMHDGRQYIAVIERDDHMGAPWLEHDGHGVVSDWTSRDKRPGELVLNEDGCDKRYYDFAETVKVARRDGWGIGAAQYLEFVAKHGRAPTARETAAIAAMMDYDNLRAWCNDEWFFVQLAVYPVCACCGQRNEKHAYYLGGIDGMDDDYLTELMRDAAAEITASEEKETEK